MSRRFDPLYSETIHVRPLGEIQIEADDALNQLTSDQIAGYLAERYKRDVEGDPALILIWEEFRRRGDAPPILKEFIYQKIGRIL